MHVAEKCPIGFLLLHHPTGVRLDDSLGNGLAYDSEAIKVQKTRHTVDWSYFILTALSLGVSLVLVKQVIIQHTINNLLL
jgi:hypothetical protein